MRTPSQGQPLEEPSARPAWHVVLPVSVGTGFSLLGDSALYTVLPLNLDVVGVSLASAGVLLSVNRLVRLFLNAPVGSLYDRWPRRRLFLPALFLGAISTAIYALTTGFGPLLIGRVLWGLAWTGIWVGGNTIIMDVSQESARGRWVGFYQAAFFLGAAGGAAIGGLLADLLGFRWSMGVGAALAFLSAVYVFCSLPETRQVGAPAADPERRVHPSQDRVEPIRHGGEFLPVNLLLGLNRLVAAGVIPATIGLFLAQQLGDPVRLGSGMVGAATLAGLGLGMSTLISAGAVPLLGRASDQAKTRWQVVSFGLFAGVLGFSFLGLGTPWAILPSLILIAINSASNTGLSTTLVGDLSGAERRSRQLGVLYTVGDLGSAIGPPLAYGILPFLGLQGLYYLMALLLGGMLVLSIYQSQR